MKILYFSRDYSPHDERFLTALSQTEHEVSFLRLSPSCEIILPSGIREEKLVFHNNDSFFTDDVAVTSLKQVLSTLNPDLIHAGPLHGPAYIAALSGSAPLASMSWGADILHDGEVDPDARRRIAHSLQHSTVFIGDCQVVVDKAVKEYDFPADRVFRFPWGVDLAHFSPTQESRLRDGLGWKHNFVFLSNRSFEDIYGVGVVMRAFIKAQAVVPEIRLLLYGRGSRQQEILGMAEQAGVMEKIYFAAFVGQDDLPASYQAADVFLSASHCDGSSVSLMEALACGKPALVSNIPGNLEWVRSGENGWVFQDGNSDELANMMVAVSKSSHLPAMRTKARLLAEEKADWKRNFLVLLQAYEAARQPCTPADTGRTV